MIKVSELLEREVPRIKEIEKLNFPSRISDSNCSYLSCSCEKIQLTPFSGVPSFQLFAVTEIPAFPFSSLLLVLSFGNNAYPPTYQKAQNACYPGSNSILYVLDSTIVLWVVDFHAKSVVYAFFTRSRDRFSDSQESEQMHSRRRFISDFRHRIRVWIDRSATKLQPQIDEPWPKGYIKYK